jgi:hypothetical protein
MREFLKLLFAPCSEIARRTSLSLDQKLPRSHRAAIRFHYLYCTACRRYRRQIKFMREVLRALAGGQLADEALGGLGLPQPVRERIKRALTQQ